LLQKLIYTFFLKTDSKNKKVVFKEYLRTAGSIKEKKTYDALL
jgi:hypothetical protein